MTERKKVYLAGWGEFFPPPHPPNRDYRQLQEGVDTCPNIERVASWEDAEMVFIKGDRFKGDASKHFPGKQTVYFDMADWPHLDPVKVDLYLKRNFVNKPEGAVPFNYMAMEQYFPTEPTERMIDLCCTLRPDWRLRQRVIEALWENYHGRDNVQLGPVDENKLQGVSNAYHQIMWHSKIIVTCQPDSWEGDNRTFEALASGALVIVNRHRFMEPAYQDRDHIIFYDEPEEVPDLVDFYLKMDDVRDRIAQAGFEFTKNHHTCGARMSQVLRILEERCTPK